MFLWWLFLSCSAILSLTRVCTLFFFPPAIFYFLFFYDLTCGTNAKQQDRRLWVWMLYFPMCKWLRLCVSVCECAEESSLQKRLDPHLFDGYIIFELALQLFFIHWTFFFVHKPENTLVQFEFFLTLHWGFFFPKFVSTIATGYSVYITAASSLSIHLCTYRGQNISRFR